MRRVGTALLIATLGATPAGARFIDADETIQLVGRFYSQAALRTVDSSGFTFPRTPPGHLVQHRNLAELEWSHDLDRRLSEWRPPWLSDIAYRLRFKGVYEGVYDYGPSEYSDQVEVNPPSPFDPTATPESRTIDRTRILRKSLGRQYELWNAYAQASLGPLFLRIGRQDLSWGETDGFRLLDMIEPLDNRFGFPLVEDLDDRRIPLWMTRATLALPWRSAAVSDLTLDGYFVPGPIEDQEAPLAPRGSPFAAPAAPSFFERIVKRPGEKWADSRGGMRLIGVLFGDTTVSLAHYVTWNDAPATRVVVSRVDDVGGRPVARPGLEFSFYQQQVSGATLTRHLKPPLDTVLRTELAMFWNERVFDPPRAGSGPPAFPELIASAIADKVAGGRGTSRARFTDRDVLRWVVGLDKTFWVRTLNASNTFFVSSQIFHTHIFDHVDSIRNGITDPASRDFVARKADEWTWTLLANTLYWRGRIQPGVFASYDPRGVFAVVPSLTFLVGTHVRVTAKYAYIDGSFANLGFFRDRDEALLRFEVSL